MNDSRQRQRHGVKKKMVEGVGGLVVGAALVLLMREVFKRRTSAGVPATASTASETTSGDSA